MRSIYLVLTTLSLAWATPTNEGTISQGARSARLNLGSSQSIRQHLQQKIAQTHKTSNVAHGDLEQISSRIDDKDIKCIDKVVFIEETEYDRGIKCNHGLQEKCHLTYITEYTSSTEQRCETNFQKQCHITFKSMPFNETITICHTPIVNQCDDDFKGEDICSTHYETNCETVYKSKQVEQDEPVCVMEIVKNCTDIEVSEAGTQVLRQECEDWPVQKCEVTKKLVTKVEPETSCKKIPREICAPNNCRQVPGDEICRDEERIQVQRVPQEECDLQPEEHCFMDSVLVPKLVPKENCVQVPKETCVNTKSNPRIVKRPVVKQWCYNPNDLL